ncbi:TetR/AcrR family transcriptional regulator [Adhaeribacter soli]|uniref:TetR/AcrR family transcriptional regulator n=2 Tax=Adhaeribacter soli TaxID=2607655 RepID=A0A5N1IMB7_9BACT|nr:TetR/AcrR family transcriptional regulator [Adhaeribacter soli]
MELKDKILAVAFEMFRKRGIRSVSMDDIAQEMAISKKTIYKWYENKDAIVFAALDTHLQQMQADCELCASRGANAIDELFKTMTMIREMLTNIHPSIFYDLQKFHPNSWQLFQEHKNGYILGMIVQNINRGIEEGLYRPDLDLPVLSRLRLYQIDLAFSFDVFPPDSFDPQRVQQACLEHFMLGIATLKGHKLINKYKHVTEEE